MKKVHIDSLVDECMENHSFDVPEKDHLRFAIVAVQEMKECIPPIHDTAIESLRSRILARMNTGSDGTQQKFTLFSFIHMYISSRWGIASIGVFCIMFIFSFFVLFQKDMPQDVLHKEKYAFGPLGATSQLVKTVESDSYVSNQRLASGGGLSVDSKMIASPAYIFRYEYKGDAYEIPNDLPVYKRVVSSEFSRTLGTFIKKEQNPFFTLQRTNPSVERISLKDKATGYTYEIDMSSGKGYIHTSYYGEDFDTPPIAFLNDEEAIDLAYTFITDNGIDATQYALPRIDDRWKRYIDVSAPEESFLPYDISVVFPEQVEGNIVYDSAGEFPIGMTIQIHHAKKLVQNVSNITVGSVESSVYDLIQDTDRITRLAQHGGRLYQWQPEGSDVKEYTYTLGTPEHMYMEYYLSDVRDGNPSSVYIPALRFPVIGGDEPPEYYSRPLYVTVPLIKEVVEELEYVPEHTPEASPIIYEVRKES